MNRSETITQLATALAAAQAEMRPAVINTVNPHLKNRYADLAAVMEAAKPLSKNGVAIIQSPSILVRDGETFVRLENLLVHTSGEWISEVFEMKLPPDARGVTPVQQVGSIITYLRRYTLAPMVGIVADEDTDGNAPSYPTKPKNQPPSATVDEEELAYGDGEIVSSSNVVEKRAFDEYRRAHDNTPPANREDLRVWYNARKV